MRGAGQAFVNCIIWGDSSPLDVVSESVFPIHSCVQEGVGGRYNISLDSQFRDPAALDFRLAAGSPCIDAGKRYYLFAPPIRDADGLGRLARVSVDMGTYEFGSTADADGDLLSDAAEALAGTDPAVPDTPTGLFVTPTSGTIQQAVVNDLSGSSQGFSVAVTGVGGALASGGSVGNVFRHNDIQARTRSFFLQNAQEITITSNTIRVNQTAPATSAFGVLATDLGHVMSNVTFNITCNNLAQLNATTNHSDGYGVTGIQLEYNGSSRAYNVTNNMIGRLKLTRTSARSAGQLCGIRHSASNDATLNIYHNSINSLNSFAPYTGLDGGNCMGFGITGAGFTGTVRFKNNIIRMAQPGSVAIARLGAGGTWDSDYNNLYAANGATCCRFGSQDYATLAQWQVVSGLDLHSRDVDPAFPNFPYIGCWTQAGLTSSDLHFAAYPGHTFAGVLIPGIDIDIDGEPRDVTAPYMRADEVAHPALTDDTDGDGLPDLLENAAG